MMCEKGAYGSLINSRVLSCEVLRGKAATAEMAGHVVGAARSFCQAQLGGKMPPPEGTACSRHVWRGLAKHSRGKTFTLESFEELHLKSLCLMNMMSIRRMFSCISPWGSSLHGCFFFTVILLGLCFLHLHLDALCIQLD